MTANAVRHCTVPSTEPWPRRRAAGFAFDHEDYQWALVSGPSRSYFWILARESSLPDSLLAELVATAHDSGFAVGDLIWVEQDNPQAE